MKIRIKTWIKLILAGGITAYMVLSVPQYNLAHAVGPTKPTMMSGTADTSKADKAVSKGVNYILSFVYLAAVLTAAIGLFLTLPVVGNPELGKKAIKGAIVVVIVTGLFHIFAAFIGGVV